MTFRHYGTVIEATHRPEDLVPAFMSVLEDLDPERHAEISEHYADVLAWTRTERTSEDAFSYGYHPDTPHLLEALDYALDEHAPDGYYFGAHPGDGADFGFWEITPE